MGWRVFRVVRLRDTGRSVRRDRAYPGEPGARRSGVAGLFWGRLAGAGTSGLLVGFIFAQCAGMLPLFRLARARFRVAGHVVSFRGIASVLRQFRNFPLISTWGALVEAIGGAVALYLLIGMFYPAAITGFLFLTERAVGRPLRMVAELSRAPVAFSEAGRAVHTDPTQLRRRFLQLTLRSSVVAACWIVTVNIAAAWLFPMVFGPGWSDAVPYVASGQHLVFFRDRHARHRPLAARAGSAGSQRHHADWRSTVRHRRFFVLRLPRTGCRGRGLGLFDLSGDRRRGGYSSDLDGDQRGAIRAAYR